MCKEAHHVAHGLGRIAARLLKGVPPCAYRPRLALATAAAGGGCADSAHGAGFSGLVMLHGLLVELGPLRAELLANAHPT